MVKTEMWLYINSGNRRVNWVTFCVILYEIALYEKKHASTKDDWSDTPLLNQIKYGV